MSRKAQYWRPKLHESIVVPAVNHSLRIYIDKDHPLHQGPWWISQFPTRSTSFNSSCCPDRVLCPCSPPNIASAVLEVITNAFNVRVVLWHDSIILHQDGLVICSEYHVNLQNQLETCQHLFNSLLPEYSGKSLIEHSSKEKSRSTSTWLETKRDDMVEKTESRDDWWLWWRRREK